jgi:membrane-associated protein
MEFFKRLYDLLRHLGEDARWTEMINYIGTPTLYVVLFAIIFAETGLVVTPFLPGDSLLFAIGAIAARGVGIDLTTVVILLTVAAILGDAVNYWIGYKLGPAVFNREDSKLLNRKHLLKAHEFYEKYGGKTIILARFVPVVRTFAPFVAGAGKMNYFKFAVYNVIGAILWVAICVSAGWFFGGFEFVKKRFELVIVVIVLISVLPMVIEFVRAKRQKKESTADAAFDVATTGRAAPDTTTTGTEA